MSPTMSRQHRQSGSYYQQSARTPVLSDDEEQNSDGLEDTFSDDDDEDVVDTDLAPEQQAGQFAFGTDPTAQQQFHFGDDVNMS